MSARADEAIATWARYAESLQALREVLGVLDSARIPALVVKGMVLAQQLYDDVAKRPMSDIDLRVRPSDFFRVIRAMRARGHRIYWSSRQLGAVSFGVGRTLVEFETTIGPPGLCALTVAELMRRSCDRWLADGVRAREPELHDHAVLLTINLFKDKMVFSPPWSVQDMAQVARLPSFHARVFVERVRAARAQTVAWIVADWLSRERGMHCWGELRDLLGDRPLRGVYARAFSKLVMTAPSSTSIRVLARLAADAPRDRAIAIGSAALGTVVSATLSRFQR